MATDSRGGPPPRWRATLLAFEFGWTSGDRFRVAHCVIHSTYGEDVT